MEISSTWVGMKSRKREVRLSPRQTMLYAAGLHDANPLYFDDLKVDPLYAHPLNVVALTWPMSAQFSTYWPLEGFPQEVLSRQVHYREGVQWRRPLRASEILSIEGSICTVQPHPSGTFLELEYRATEPSGALVFCERVGALLRGVRCLDAGQGEALARPDFFSSPPEAMLWEESIMISDVDAHIYDACSEIHFPIHTSRAFAKQVALPGILYQGTATLGRAISLLLDREGQGDPNRLKGVQCSYKAMVFPGSTVRVRCIGRESAEAGHSIYFEVLTASGQAAIRAGSLELDA